MGTATEDVDVGKVKDIVKSNEVSNLDDIAYQRPQLIRSRRADLNINTSLSQEKRLHAQKSE